MTKKAKRASLMMPSEKEVVREKKDPMLMKKEAGPILDRVVDLEAAAIIVAAKAAAVNTVEVRVKEAVATGVEKKAASEVVPILDLAVVLVAVATTVVRVVSEVAPILDPAVVLVAAATTAGKRVVEAKEAVPILDRAAAPAVAATTAAREVAVNTAVVKARAAEATTVERVARVKEVEATTVGKRKKEVLLISHSRVISNGVASIFLRFSTSVLVLDLIEVLQTY